jgi:hypothetical protein
MVIRNALSLGLHRDGSNFEMDPFETEMRRRLWWQIVVLDIRINEDFGSDATLSRGSYDTKIFLNINHTDIWPGMTELPKDRVGFTDSTFSRIRATVSEMYQRLLQIPQTSGPSLVPVQHPLLAEKCAWIEDLTKNIEKDFLKYCDLTIPFQWGTVTVARLVLAKLWLIAHQPMRKQDANTSQATKDRLFEVGVDMIEYSRLMMMEKSIRKWGWMSRTYVQWHAVAFVLRELTTRTKGPEVERAWNAVHGIWNEWDQVFREQKNGIWKPMRRLLSQAKAAREVELDNERKMAQRSDMQNLSATEMDFGTATTSPSFENSITPDDVHNDFHMFTLDEGRLFAQLPPGEELPYADAQWGNSIGGPPLYPQQYDGFLGDSNPFTMGNLW